MDSLEKKLKEEIMDNGDWNYIAHIPNRFVTSQKLKNFILARKEEGKKAMGLESLPYHIVVEPTNMCNLACMLCSTGLGSKSRSKGIMPLKNYKGIINVCKDTVLELYLQNWGEATLVPHLPEMIQFASAAGIWTHLSTNFSVNYNEGYLERLMNSGLAVLQIDLDGTTQEVYESYRRKGDLERVIENIRKVVKIKKDNKLVFPLIEAVMLVMQHNEHQINEFKELAEGLFVDRYRMNGIQVNPNTSMKWLPENKDYVYQSYRETRRTTPCHWPWSGLVINWDGGVSPCCIVDDAGADFGNIFIKELMTIWNNDFFISSRSQFGDKENIIVKTICNICKNDTHNGKLKRFKDSFSLIL